MAFSKSSLIKDILDDTRACAIVERHFPGATSHPAVDEAMYLTVGELMGYPQAIMFRGKIQTILTELARLDPAA